MIEIVLALRQCSRKPSKTNDISIENIIKENHIYEKDNSTTPRSLQTKFASDRQIGPDSADGVAILCKVKYKQYSEIPEHHAKIFPNDKIIFRKTYILCIYFQTLRKGP